MRFCWLVVASQGRTERMSHDVGVVSQTWGQKKAIGADRSVFVAMFGIGISSGRRMSRMVRH